MREQNKYLLSNSKISDMKTASPFSDHKWIMTNILSVVVRENQAMPKDGGRPISLIFSAFNTYQIRLRITLFKLFSGFFIPRLTTPPSFGTERAKISHKKGHLLGS